MLGGGGLALLSSLAAPAPGKVPLIDITDLHHPPQDVRPDDRVLPNDLRPGRVQVKDNGQFRLEPTSAPSNFLLYNRGDAKENEAARREALPARYVSTAP